jgi:hypothetical protein
MPDDVFVKAGENTSDAVKFFYVRQMRVEQLGAFSKDFSCPSPAIQVFGGPGVAQGEIESTFGKHASELGLAKT